MAEHELKRIELMEAQSRVAMLEEKLEQVATVKTAVVHDRRTLLLHKDTILAEIKHLSDEHDDRSRTLAGPPRRDPSDDDKRQFHALVTRKAAQMKQLNELDARLGHLDRREQLALRSELSLKPLLEAARMNEATLQDSVDAIDEHRHDLPMVVGRSMFKPADTTSASDDEPSHETTATAVTELHTDPNALLAYMTMASKLELLKHAAAPVHEHFTVAKRLAAETWKRNELKVLAQQEFEVLKTRLADARDRVVAQQTTSLRADLMHAITRFHVRCCCRFHEHLHKDALVSDSRLAHWALTRRLCVRLARWKQAAAVHLSTQRLRELVGAARRRQDAQRPVSRHSQLCRARAVARSRPAPGQCAVPKARRLPHPALTAAPAPQ